MDANARAELQSIKGELNSIINELDDISGGVRRDFVGIGNDKCSNCIGRVSDHYRGVLSKLNNLDTSTLTESFARAMGLIK